MYFRYRAVHSSHILESQVRDGHTCQHCKGKSKDHKLHCHHIVFRSEKGTDAPDNLICICNTCHDALHRGEFKLSNRRSKTKHPTEVGIIKSQIKKSDWNFIETFGYETKYKREQILELPKTHYFDAVSICCNDQKVELEDIFGSSLLYVGSLKSNFPFFR